VTPVLAGSSLKALQVEMRLTGDADGETVLVIPSGKSARQGDPYETFSDLTVKGATVTATERNVRSLKHKPRAPLVVSYRVTQKSEIRMNTVVQPNFFSANGRRLFLWVDGREDFRFRFRWGAVPAGWTVASDLEHNGGSGVGERGLYDSTLIGGTNLVVRELKLGTGRFRMALPDDLGLDANALADLVTRSGRAANEVWEDGSQQYLVTVTPVILPGAKVYAGLGLTDAYAMFLTRDPDAVMLKSTIAHEYLHTWIGKRFGTSAPGWFTEGFTDYYAAMVNLRAGTFSPADYAEVWNGALLEYASSPLRTATNAKIEALRSEDEPLAVKMDYLRGSMIAALFDYRIRSASHGKLNLTDVMRAVKRDVDAGAKKGDAAGRLVAKARTLAGVDLQPDIDRYLTAGEALILPADLLGGCGGVETVAVARFDRGFEPVPPGKAIERVDPASRAFKAGLRAGMVFVVRTAGKPGDSRVEMVLRVRDGDAERLIRYMPASDEILAVQQVRVVEPLAGACTRILSGLAA